jgi:hypothetical protein
MSHRLSLSWLTLALLAGCAGSDAPAPNNAATSSAPADYTPPADGAAAELSADDKAAAEKQQICPVTGEKLFGHGTPVKVTVKDRAVFLCCQPCEETLKGDPDKYLAKLDAPAATPEGTAAPATETPAPVAEPKTN